MMLDINFVKLREGFLQYLPFAALLGIVLFIELGILFLTKSFTSLSIVTYSQYPNISNIENTKLLGLEIYTKYFYLFQLSGIILLVAMIGSISLTLKHSSKMKKQVISSQNFVNASDAIEKKKINLGEGL